MPLGGYGCAGVVVDGEGFGGSVGSPVTVFWGVVWHVDVGLEDVASRVGHGVEDDEQDVVGVEGCEVDFFDEVLHGSVGDCLGGVDDLVESVGDIASGFVLGASVDGVVGVGFEEGSPGVLEEGVGVVCAVLGGVGGEGFGESDEEVFSLFVASFEVESCGEGVSGE